MQVPKELNYNQLQTKAFFSIYKEWPIQPISNGGQYWGGQVVRIFFNGLTDGVMDPYRSHIQITVSCESSTLPVGLLQVDNSAQSFIQQTVLSSKNREVERIVQYGILAAYLNDIGLSQIYCQGRSTQGLGYSNIDNYSNIYTSSYAASSCTQTSMPSSGNWHVTGGNGTINPTMPVRFNYANTQVSPVPGYSPNLVFGSTRTHLHPYNTCWWGGDTDPTMNQIDMWWWYKYINGSSGTPTCSDTFRVSNQKAYGYNSNVRAEYLSTSRANDYVDTTSSFSRYQLNLESSVFNNTFPAKFVDGIVYQTYTPQMIGYMSNYQQYGQSLMFSTPNVTSLHGFTNLYSPHFAKGVRQPFISPTVAQCQMKNGQITNHRFPIVRRTFKIPLISAVSGLLIPQNQFILLPLRALNQTLLQLTLDPYAMFTSGYNDIAEFDNIGMGLMQQRAFKIERLVYNLHTYHFWNPQIDQYLKMSLNTGIAINTRFWQLGNQYQIQNSQSITNSWPVSCNQQALNQILVLFVPLDYQNLTFCRKHFRLSNNIEKLQLRINMQYFPSQPLAGNGGNPVQVDASGNNSVFLQQIFMNTGHMFEKEPKPKINQFNFAINERCYNVFNTHTFYDTSMIDDASYVWNAQTINADTAMGMSHIHENRYVGKGAYVFSFDPYSHSKQFLTGIDTRASKQFQIIFSAGVEGFFPRAQTMYIYTRSSVIIEYSKNGIINVNR